VQLDEEVGRGPADRLARVQGQAERLDVIAINLPAGQDVLLDPP
jgi:hypothetical protein